MFYWVRNMTGFLFLHEGKHRKINKEIFYIDKISFLKINVSIKSIEKTRDQRFIIKKLIKLRKKGIKRIACAGNNKLCYLCNAAGIDVFDEQFYYKIMADKIIDAFFKSEDNISLYTDKVDENFRRMVLCLCDKYSDISIFAGDQSERLAEYILDQTGVAITLSEIECKRRIRVMFCVPNKNEIIEKDTDININFTLFDRIFVQEYKKFKLFIPSVECLPEQYRNDGIFALYNVNTEYLKQVKIIKN